MGKSTISMAIFNSYVKLPEGNIRGKGSNMTPVVAGFNPKKERCSSKRIIRCSKHGGLIPSGKLTKNYGKLPCFMGKFTINGDVP